MKRARQWLVISLAVALTLYSLSYILLRAGGAISAHTSQGYFELEFQDHPVWSVFSPEIALFFFEPLFVLELPFLRLYTEEPTGG